MADPFQDVDAAGEDFISAFADSMDERQADPTMEKILSSYLGKLAFPEDSLTIEVGGGAGAVTRRIGEKANPTRIIGFEPSRGFVKEARARCEIGQAMHDGLIAEYRRRAESDTLYGYQVFATLIARRP